MQIKPIAEITAFLEPVAAEQGLEIVDVEWKGSALTVYIDKEGGVDLDACEAFHRAIDEPLDALDPTFGAAYTLNVSSPGLDRPFKKERDFLKNIGNRVEVRLYAPRKGKKVFEAVLLDYTGSAVRLSCGKEDVTIELNKIAKISQAIDFE